MTKHADRARAGSTTSAERRSRFITASALATGLLAGLVPPATAADHTWVAPADVDESWDVEANWDVNDAPDATTDTAVFNSGHTVTSSTPKSIDGIRYDAGADSGTIVNAFFL